MVASNGLWIVNVKTAIIRALRTALDDVNYPDAKIRGMTVSMEYPMEQNLYPHIWVEFSFSKLQQAGIGHTIFEDGVVKQEWMFEGTVRLTILALTSYERDVYASQFLQLFAFNSLNPTANQFAQYLKNDVDVYISLNTDSLVPAGQSATVGAPWDEGTMTPVYQDGYAFNVVGQIVSSFTVTPEYLREIQLTATGLLPDGTELGDLVHNYDD